MTDTMYRSYTRECITVWPEPRKPVRPDYYKRAFENMKELRKRMGDEKALEWFKEVWHDGFTWEIINEMICSELEETDHVADMEEGRP